MTLSPKWESFDPIELYEGGSANRFRLYHYSIDKISDLQIGDFKDNNSNAHIL